MSNLPTNNRLSVIKNGNNKNRNYLLGKVVLLIGNDSDTLENLVIKLAKKGADIALYCWQMPQDTVIKIKQTVQAMGQKLLLIQQVKLETINGYELIHLIRSELGQLDILIDLSKEFDLVPENLQRDTKQPFVKTILMEMTKA